MNSCIDQKKTKLAYKILCSLVAFTFIFSIIMPPEISYGQTVLNLPPPGTMIPISANFSPALIKGVNVYADNPLKLDFIIDRGNTNFQTEEFKRESTKLVKYFLAALTVPENEMWVNLSPYEKNRIIPKHFGHTEMGRDLLAQDYMLKQLSSSLMHPEGTVGKNFWNRVYKKALDKFGTTEIPMNTFNKIWIVPQEAFVYEHTKGAFVIKSHLKVMLEEDYLALEANQNSKKHGLGNVIEGDIKIISGVSSEIVREVLIPEIEREVNDGKIFANLRQVYHSVILASWYKQALAKSLLGEIYVNQNKTKGIQIQDKEVNRKIYNQYVEAFRKGVYDFIREEYDSTTQELIPRKYFAGGVTHDGINEKIYGRAGKDNLGQNNDKAALAKEPSHVQRAVEAATLKMQRGDVVTVAIQEAGDDNAILAEDEDTAIEKGSESSPVSRRNFLKAAGGLLFLSFLESCTPIVAKNKLSQLEENNRAILARLSALTKKSEHKETQQPSTNTLNKERQTADKTDDEKTKRTDTRRSIFLAEGIDGYWAGGRAYSNWVNGPFNLSDAKAIRLTFPTDQVGVKFMARLLPKGGYPNTPKGLSREIHTIPPDGIVIIPLNEFRMNKATLETIMQISFHSEEDAWNFPINQYPGKKAIPEKVEKLLDEAMLGEAKNMGGIDLNPMINKMKIQRDGNGVALPIAQQPIESMNVEGFLPVIINVTPIINLPRLIGLNKSEQDESKKQISQNSLDLFEYKKRFKLS